MTINTTNFGELDVSPEQIIRVEAGLLGLEDHTEFVLVNNADAGGKIPFWWLQSCKDPDTAFVVTIPFLFEKGYEVDIPDDIVRVLGIKNEEEVAIYSICKIVDKFEDMTINLKSPVILNATNNRAMQIVMHESAYEVDEPAIKKYRKYFTK